MSRMKDRITYLFMQYYKNESTEKELEEFFHLIASAQFDEEIEQLIKTVYNEIKKSNPSLTYINEEGELVLNEPKWLQKPIFKNKRKKISKWVTIAAACFILMISSTFWLYPPKSTHPPYTKLPNKISIKSRKQH